MQKQQPFQEMKVYRILAIIIAMQISFATASAQASYYKEIDGKKGGEALKTALHELIKSHKKISYGSGEDKTWGAFYTTDAAMENGKRRVLDMYSSQKRYFGDKGSAVGGMNIEHSVAKSWWGGTQNNAYCDLHHLNPSDQNANSRKSNYPLGELTSVSWENGVTFVGKANIDGSNQNAYEPCDEYKGDFARVFMYMFTCYQDLTWEYTWMNYEKSTYPTLKPWAVKLLLKWHRQDPVSEKEVNRNNAVYAIQGNRNPFVDYPQLADYVWGDSISFVFHINGEVESGTGNGNIDSGDDKDDNNDNNGGDEENGNDNNGEGNNGNFAGGQFVLVTDADRLTFGDSIVIGYENYAMGASSSNGNFREKTDMMTSNGTITYLADDAQIIVLEEGAVADTYALNVDGRYLAAASSSSNYLKTNTALDANSSWTISISDGLATITAQGTHTRNTLQYNVSSPRFSCYKSGQKAVNIYAKSPGTTTVEEITGDWDELVDVYSLSGTCLRRQTEKKKALEGLEKGIYICGKKKIVVR